MRVLRNDGSEGVSLLTQEGGPLLGHEPATIAFDPRPIVNTGEVYDPEGTARDFMNMETLVTCPVTVAHWEEQLLGLIGRHADETMSRKAQDILQHWDLEKDNFLQVCPKEMLAHIKAPLGIEAEVERA